MSETLTINTPDGAFSAYVARPKAANAPAIVVIQEIFGVNKVMRDICDGLAAQGFVAVCPDLFWRIEPGIDITDQTEEEWKQAFDLFGKFDVEYVTRRTAWFGAGREKRIYAIPPFTRVVSLDFEDHPFEIQSFEEPCALCGAENVYLDEVILDDRGGRMFVCSDTDHCEGRLEQGHKGRLAPEDAYATRETAQ